MTTEPETQEDTSGATDRRFAATIDWEQHWDRTDREQLTEMRAAGERMAERLDRYVQSFPETLLDVGCGPAFTLFELAANHPKSEFLGIDPAGSVLAQNRRLAADRGLRNLRFRQGSLPTVGLDRQFDCVTCIATLHYVAAIEQAIERLFETTTPGGTLVFNYPNRHTRRLYKADPETDPERFELLLSGENVLTRSAIRQHTGRQPRNFWRAVDEPDWRSMGQTNPCVVIAR
ncbi:MAG: methylase involved in ubiquinone/menaquinone biosynthesis [halophilic archaeon J07HX5]|jgi:Methylase involved in ubiquinone/menaquinone biosynthesis|nr:MAG: methylase involved in ubiquinone/menaquinone biosynthesis [halophilic archaeon J07HX5]